MPGSMWAGKPSARASLVGRPGEHSRMAIEGAAHALAGSDLREHGIHHFPIGLQAGLALLVMARETAHAPIHLREPQLHGAVGQYRENDVRFLYVASRQRRDMRSQRHADPDADETSPTAHASPQGGRQMMWARPTTPDL